VGDPGTAIDARPACAAKHSGQRFDEQCHHDDFCRFLERHLDRPLINETNLAGNFDLQVTREKPRSDDFIQRLRDRLGLVVTVWQRPLEVLIFSVRPSRDQ